MPRQIVAYMTSWCPDCTRARRVLQELRIKYHEIDVERVSGADSEMRRLNGGSGKVPTILIGEQILIEPSDDELRSALRARTASLEH